MQISINDFFEVDIRKGNIIDAVLFKEAIKPAFKLWIDFGPEIGIKKSSAQITNLYNSEDLKGKSILAVINLPPRQIGPFISEVLILSVKISFILIIIIFNRNRFITKIMWKVIFIPFFKSASVFTKAS